MPVNVNMCAPVLDQMSFNGVNSLTFIEVEIREMLYLVLNFSFFFYWSEQVWAGRGSIQEISNTHRRRI